MKKTLMVFIVLGLLCSYNISFGDIFKYTDNDGVIHLTNVYDSEPCKTYGCKLVLVEKQIPPESVLGKSSSDWVEYNRDKDGSIFLYNKKNMTKSEGKNVVQVWRKWIFSEKERQDYLRIIRKDECLSTEGCDKLSYSVSLSSVDCKKKKSKVLSIILYDIDGNILYYGSSDKSKWMYIVPDTNEDTLRKKVCK